MTFRRKLAVPVSPHSRHTSKCVGKVVAQRMKGKSCDQGQRRAQSWQCRWLSVASVLHLVSSLSGQVDRARDGGHISGFHGA